MSRLVVVSNRLPTLQRNKPTRGRPGGGAVGCVEAGHRLVRVERPLHQQAGAATRKCRR